MQDDEGHRVYSGGLLSVFLMRSKGFAAFTGFTYICLLFLMFMYSFDFVFIYCLYWFVWLLLADLLPDWLDGWLTR